MIYLDYAANYPVKKEVLDYMSKVELAYFGNANSIHSEGKRSYQKFESMDNHIKNMLNLNSLYEIVYTSSATESNNLAIKGIAKTYSGFGKHILVSPYEHSSVNSALATLKDSGFEIEFLSLDKYGHIDLEKLDKQIRNDTILVVTIFVESEAGIINDVKSINEIVSKHKNCHHLVDATQGIFKEPLDLNKLELVSFTPHKFGGLVGTGCLIKKKSTILYPLINGGKSSSIYRAGSIPLGQIATIEKSIELEIGEIDKNNKIVKELHDYLIEKLKEIKEVEINSTSFPYIINISIKNIKASLSCAYLDNEGICVSQKSACSITNTPSKTIMALYNNKARAMSSFRISLSSLTLKEELDTLIVKLGGLING